jgi:LysM repeat protein
MAGQGGKKGGLASALTGNGCLRYVVTYVGALLLLLVAIGTGGFGLLARLGLPSPNAKNTGTISVASQGVAAPTRAAAAAPQTGGSAPTSGGANVSTAGQPDAGNSLINSMPLPGAQGALITPYVAPAFYIVQPGDTLDTVAAMYGLTRDDLRSYNRLSQDMLLVGQVIYLPPSSYTRAPSTGRNAGADGALPSEPSNSDGNP